jgi:hypothetical protein
MTTRVPMTRANILFYTKAPRKKVGPWLDDLVGDGMLEVDADDAGEMVWAVRGAERPARGPTRIEEVPGSPAVDDSISARLERLRGEALQGMGRTTALTVSREAKALLRQGSEGEKNLLAAGLLGFFFGPLGLLYAAPFKVAVPLSILAVVLASTLGIKILFGFPILFAALAAAYAWRFNQKGERAPLLGDDDGGEPRALGPRKR